MTKTTEDKLVTHYIHGLSPSMQAKLSVCTFYNYQRNKAIERYQRRGKQVAGPSSNRTNKGLFHNVNRSTKDMQQQRDGLD